MDMNKQRIHRASGQSEHIQQFGPYKIEPLLTEVEEAAATVYRVRIEAHQRTSTSFHRVAEEFYFVLTGTGTAILDGSSQQLQPGDFLPLHHSGMRAALGGLARSIYGSRLRMQAPDRWWCEVS